MAQRGGEKRIAPAVDQEKALQDHAPWRQPTYTPEQIGAIRALSQGVAEAHQQRLAFQFVVDLSYNGGAHFFPGPEGARNTDFALGRAWIGKQLVTMAKWIVTPGGEQG